VFDPIFAQLFDPSRWLNQNLSEPLKAAWADGFRTGAGATALVLILLYLLFNNNRK